MATITVKAKTTAGFHPGLNVNIVKGDSYEIQEEQWGDQLFERPSPDWLAPWEQTATADPATTPKKEGKK